MDYENPDEGAARFMGEDANIVSIGAVHDASLMGARYLVGSAVQSHKGEDLGEIKEVMLDIYSGQVSYAVLCFGGGFLGMGKKLFAVPWDALMFDARSGFVVLQVDRDRLKRAPGFDKNSWPSRVDDSYWWQGIQSYYRHNS